MWKRITASKKRARKLRADERERVRDTLHLVQSARETLADVDPKLIPEMDDIEQCFDMANRSLRQTLRSN